MSNDSLLGIQLDEYRLEALLGRGGMARVYRGLDTRLNRYVAVKVIETEFRSDMQYAKRFEIEAQAIARLDHPHVVRLYRYGEVNGLLYMAMQFIEGADLGFLLESYRLEGEFIPAAEALRLIGEICQALDYVHSHGIIHRDIKPSNIMLTRDEGRAILTDFGLALRAEVGTRGEVFGSPHYIAPEQAVSSARSVPQSDLYSLGVILYEMFTGVLPFNAADAMDIAVMHMSNTPPLPREVRRDISPEVEAVIMKALEKKPEDRYQSGRALALALERALRKQGQPVLPTNRSIPERVTIGMASNPLPELSPLPAAVTPARREFEVPPPPRPMPEEEKPIQPTSEPYLETIKMFPVDPPKPVYNKPILPTLPGQVTKKPSPLVLIGIAGVIGLFFFACLIISGLSFLLKAGGQEAQIPQETAQATVVSQKTIQATVVSQKTMQPAVRGDFRLKFSRCEDEGCLVVINTGNDSFPLSNLSMKGKNASMAGNEWGVVALQPGECVKVVKDENWIRKMPEDTSCEEIGHGLMREGKDRFWTNAFTIYFQDKKVVECMKKGDWCEMLIQPD